MHKRLKFSEFLDSQEFLENSREISLLALDLEAFSFHFSFSISILSHFHFTFHSRSRLQGFFISLFILEMSEPDFHFTFHFSKWVNQIFISFFTSRTSNIHSRRTLSQSWKSPGLLGSWLEPPQKCVFPSHEFVSLSFKTADNQVITFSADYWSCEKNGAFVSKLEKSRAAGELIRASSKIRVPVAWVCLSTWLLVIWTIMVHLSRCLSLSVCHLKQLIIKWSPVQLITGHVNNNAEFVSKTKTA